MTRLRQLLNSPLVPLAALTGGFVVTILAVWFTGVARATLLSVAVLAIAFWGVLATYKIWRVGQRIQTVEAEVARGSTPSWARPMRSALADIRSSSGNSVLTAKRSLEEVEALRAVSSKRHTQMIELLGMPATSAIPAELLSVLPTHHHAELSACTVTDLLYGLRRTRPDTVTLIGPEPTRNMLDVLLDENAMDSRVVHLDPHHRGIELGLIDVLVVDTNDQEQDSLTLTMLGTLPPRAEIWILGARVQRDELVEQLQQHDHDLAHVIRHNASSVLTMLGKAIS